MARRIPAHAPTEAWSPVVCDTCAAVVDSLTWGKHEAWHATPSDAEDVRPLQRLRVFVRG